MSLLSVIQMGTPREPTIVTDGGPWALHDQRCAVLPGEPAVLRLETGVFYPSWAAQRSGWRLIRCRTWLQRCLWRWFFAEG